MVQNECLCNLLAERRDVEMHYESGVMQNAFCKSHLPVITHIHSCCMTLYELKLSMSDVNEG